ncbi:MAG: Beta-lactamase domain protein [Parcubacteria group bacterium GW2011_GWA2_49_9]|nr:MAG: Beta-lactamase domain protein [Parcubacteria group bacterium GW2011_GWA2_49_9]
MRATLSFFGGVGSVTGSNFMLKGERTTLLVDCGLIQGEKFAHDLNREPFAYDPASVDFLLITHAHIDHVGRIPKLVRDGFKGKILSTPETLDLSRLMLPDAFSVLRMETPEDAELLYDEQDIEKAFSLWETVPYHTKREVGEFEIFLKDSGHILGSAMYEISLTKGSTAVSGRRVVSPLLKGVPHSDEGRVVTIPSLADSGTPFTEQPPKAAPFSKGDGDRKIVFTGDLGNYPTPLLKSAEDITDATYLVMESVYGDRNHEGGGQRKDRLKEVIRDTIQRKGVLLIPCFSLEKTQVLLSEMDELFEDKKLFDVPVFLDSPLAIRVTDVYRRYADTLNPEAQKRLQGGDDIFSFKNLRLTMDRRAASEIERERSPKIIIAGSGMSAGGRILEHERRYLGDPNNTILFIGYQAIGGLGRQIQEGVKHLHIEHEDVTVRARIETITGYSSHMDGEHLLEFAEKGEGSTEKIFVVMGEPRSALFLAQRIKDYHGIDTYVPVAGESVEIEL